jgi:hypothetical protein
MATGRTTCQRKAVIIKLTSRDRSGKKTLRLTLATLALMACGCRGRTKGFERYVPPPAPARAAVVAVLDAWRDGRPPGAGVGPRHDIHLVDNQRRPGQTLARYEVLGEVTYDNARAFAVRLSLENPAEEKVVRFLAVGLDPLWVFRQEDFEMISHWMHPMDKDKTSEQPAEPGPRP